VVAGWTMLTGQLLAGTTATPAKGWQIDASTGETNKLRRVHAGFGLPAERFGYFELFNAPSVRDVPQHRVGSETVYRNWNAVQTNPGHLCYSG
jgi:hypothetical protein